jgi:hypothetical protein
LVDLGVKDVLAVNVCGGIDKNVPVGGLQVVDDFIDFTKNRISTFFDGDEGVNHVDMTNPEKLKNYHKAMSEYAIDDYKELPNIIDFSIHQSIMDVGGGYGAALNLIKEKNHTARCVLFDLDKVIKQVSYKTIERIGGNFFEGIPKCSEAIILSRVLHDWNNKKAKLILKNCFHALPSNGTLYVIENCTDKINIKLWLLSLNMAVMCQSFERSSTEYIKLCEEFGFNFQEDKKLNQLQTILIFKK